MKSLTIIPARKGSKGIPNKNMVLLGDIPLIAYTCESALKYSAHANSKKEHCPDNYNTITLNTDDEKIISHVKSYYPRIEVPFLRPHSLASDNSNIKDAIRFTLEYYKKNDEEKYDCVILLQPTSPFRTWQDIKYAVNLYKSPSCKHSVMSVNNSKYNPIDIIQTKNNAAFIKKFIIEPKDNTNRQNYPPYKWNNGAIYIFNTEWFLKTNKIYDKNTLLTTMGNINSIDIDHPEDLELAEYYIQKGKVNLHELRLL
jgi:CMP-N,N'-diacetyllegionaminic acid synthase